MLTLDEFQSTVDDSFVPLEIRAQHPQSFRGAISQVEVHGVTFTEVRGDAHSAERTAELIERQPGHYYKVSLQLAGSATVHQAGRTVHLGVGDLTIYDASRPYRLDFSEPYRTLIVQLPHDRMRVSTRATEQMTAVRFPADEGLGRVVSPYLASLGEHFAELRGPAGATLARNAVDLLSTLLVTHLESSERQVGPRRELFERACEAIDAELGDSTLTPSRIAERVFISVRHLHCLFSEQGETVTSHLRHRRLERCYQDLLDASASELSIAAIGTRWGFKDAAHFSRSFKAAYGESPSEVRRGLATRAQAKPLPQWSTARAA